MGLFLKFLKTWNFLSELFYLNDFVSLLQEKVNSLQSQFPTELSPFTQTLMNEKNQEIDHLNDQVHQLQEELNKLTSGEEIVNLVNILYWTFDVRINNK